MKTNIIIAGKNIVLEKLKAFELKKIWIEARASFLFYNCEYKGTKLTILKQVSDKSYSPRQLQFIMQRLYNELGMNVVFLFDRLTHTQRNRLIEMDIYFVVSAKYVFLPNLLIATKLSNRSQVKKLSAVAQWILLSQIQQNNIEGKSAKEIVDKSPYQYVTITRAFRTLEDLGLCTIITDENKYKRILFNSNSIQLYQRAESLLFSPIREKFYCDNIIDITQYKLSSISALSHYTHLNDEEIKTIAISSEKWRNYPKEKLLNFNTIEGNFCIEIWKYEPINCNDKFVDKLSLALCFRNDKDPRISKEVEQMINDIW